MVGRISWETHYDSTSSVWDNMSAVYGRAKRHGVRDLADPQARLTV